MSLVEVKVPQLSESVAQATLLAWKKKPGQAVVQDEILIEIETDKVVLEVPSPAAGVIAKIVKNDGDTVVSDELIAQIDTEGAEKTSPLEVQAVKTPPSTSAASAPNAASHSTGATPASNSVAMPAAAKMMADNAVNPAQISGTGKDNRILKGDVIAALTPAPATKPSSSQALPAVQTSGAPLQMVAAPINIAAITEGRPEQRVPMSRLRARIAERLLQSQASNAILTTFNEVNMKPVIDLRNLYKDKFEKEHGVKLGFMSFFVKAAVHALKKYPVINASVDGNDIVYHGYFDIGIAVGSPRGLVVPILRNADQMSIAEIEKKIAEFGVKAKDGKLSIEEMTGGTFSISNGGVFGSMLSTPIINPPQSAILGVHATKERAVVENGQIVIRPINYLALSYDHRIIDGREAVLGLVAMKEALEDPTRLLLDI